LLGGAWLATHWLLRESAIWRDRNTEEVRGAQRDADYAYRLASIPRPQGAAAFGLAGGLDASSPGAPPARTAVRGDAAARAAAGGASSGVAPTSCVLSLAARRASGSPGELVFAQARSARR
jgi:hypothetical protein